VEAVHYAERIAVDGHHPPRHLASGRSIAQENRDLRAGTTSLRGRRRNDQARIRTLRERAQQSVAR